MQLKKTLKNGCDFSWTLAVKWIFFVTKNIAII